MAVPASAPAISLISPSGAFLNDPGQTYPGDPTLQYDSRLVLRNTINGGAIAIGDEWVLHVYHSVFPHNGNSGVNGYVGQTMDQINIDGSALASYRVIASRENAELDYAVFHVARISGGGTVTANLPVWVDTREMYPAQPGVALWGSFGPQRILFDAGGNPIQDPPHPRTIKWGTIGADGATLPGLPSDASEVSGDSGSGIFVRDGFNLRLLGADGPTITPTAAQQIDQWINDMGGVPRRYPLQIGTYSTARLGGFGAWFNEPGWSGGVPGAGDDAWIDNGATVGISSPGAAARNLYVGVGQNGLAGIATLTVSDGADLSAGTVILGLTEGAGTLARGVISQNSGAVIANTVVVGYRGAGSYTLDGGALTCNGEMILGRDPGSVAASSIGGSSTVTAAAMTVGREGAATLNQSAGIVQIAGDLAIGKLNQSAGLYNLTGGTLAVESSIQLGPYAGASGTLHVSGGKLFAAQAFVQHGALEVDGGEATITYGHLSREGRLRLTGGDLRFIQGGTFAGTIDFAATATNLSVGGLGDFSSASIVNAGTASLTALDGSLLLLPAGAGAVFGSTIAPGAIIHEVGSTLTIGGDKNISVYGTIGDFVQVNGALTGFTGVSGADIVLLKGFIVTADATLDMGTGGSAFVSVASRNDGGAISGGAMRISSGRSFTQTAGSSTFSGQVKLNPGGTITINAGTVAIESMELRGNFIQSGGDAEIAHIDSPVPLPDSAVINILGGTLTSNDLRAARLQVGPGGVVNVNPTDAPAPAWLVGSLEFTGATRGRLDLNRSKLVVDYTASSPLTQLTAEIVAGRAGGAWTGQGITSAAATAQANRFAVGIADAAELGLTSFGGVSLIDPSDPSAPITAVLVGFTYAGDANLDGSVSLSDFSLLASNFNLPGGWARGDLDYSGTISLADFSILASNFNEPPMRTGRSDAVPEPAGAVILPLALRRKRTARPSAAAATQ